MQVRVIVTGATKKHGFSANIHAHTSPGTFFLDPEDFYRKWGGEVPEQHHEIEITEPSNEELRRVALHVHASKKSERLFVCYPLAIPEFPRALDIFKVWCGGTVLTWEKGIDLNTIDTECGGDKERCLAVLAERYNIQVGRPYRLPAS